MADEVDIKIVALTSVPMCGWNPHYESSSKALRPWNIPVWFGMGPYWHASLSNLMEECVDAGIDWILTLDYDSLYTADMLDRMIGTFGRREDIDALAAMEAKRTADEDVPLFQVGTKTEVEVTDEPIQVDTAHFGLTLIRVASLAKVPMPWFLHLPNRLGSYRDLKRTDADIYFWHKWKDAGNTLYVDPLIDAETDTMGIGHLQPMVSEFSANGKIRHVHLKDWRNRHAKGVAK